MIRSEKKYVSIYKDNYQNTVKREIGEVVSLKESFGFIRISGRPDEVFFHFKSFIHPLNPIDALCIGDLVEFDLRLEHSSGRISATDLYLVSQKLVAQKEARAEELLLNEGRVLAVVTKALDISHYEREPTGGQVRVEKSDELLSFSGRDPRYFPIKLLEGDIVEISIYVDKRTRRRGATRISLVEPNMRKRERGIISIIWNKSYGFIRCADRNEQKLFFHFSERLDNEYIPHEGHGLEFNVIVDGNGKLCASRLMYVAAEKITFTKMLPTIFRGEVKYGLQCSRALKNSAKLIGGTIAFKTRVINEEVLENLSFDADDILDYENQPRLMPKDKVQFQIAIFKPTGKRHACNIQLIHKAEQVLERGVVVFLKPNEFGFIERPNTNKNIYFKIIMFEISLGDSVEYNVIENSPENFFADNIKVLPRGSVCFFDFSEEVLTGVVLRSAMPNLNKKSYYVEENKDPEEGLISFCGEIHRNPVEFKIQDVLEPRIDILAGDLVSFKLKYDLRFDEKSSAYDVMLLKPAPSNTREKGVVINLRKDFGFITSFNHPDGIFFHYSAVIGDAKNLIKCGDEFSFEPKEDRGKQLAVRLYKLPQNTADLDDVENAFYVGKIQNTGYDYINNFGFKGNGKGHLDYCNNETYNDIIVNLSPDTVINEQNNEEISKCIFSLPFRSSDLSFNPFVLFPGDFVIFKIATEKSTKKVRATSISMMPKLGRIVFANNSAGEIRDIFTKELFDFFDERPFPVDEMILLFDVQHKNSFDVAKRTATNLRVSDYLVLEKGFYEGYVKEIKTPEELVTNDTTAAYADEDFSYLNQSGIQLNQSAEAIKQTESREEKFSQPKKNGPVDAASEKETSTNGEPLWKRDSLATAQKGSSKQLFGSHSVDLLCAPAETPDPFAFLDLDSDSSDVPSDSGAQMGSYREIEEVQDSESFNKTDRP